MSTLPYILALITILSTAAFLRLLSILPSTTPTRPTPRKRTTPTHLLIVLGSGGHTAELLSSLTTLNPQTYTHRSYVISSGDGFSALKAEKFEHGISSSANDPADIQQAGNGTGNGKGKGYTIHEIPRARKIHQSLLSSPWSCLQCLWACMRLLHKHPEGRPDLILINGPATSLILVLASLILRYFDFMGFMPGVGRGDRRRGGGKGGQMRSIYVESWARVKRPSLSGRLIVYGGFCNRVLVQWKGLEEKGWGEYKGVLVR